MKQEHTNKPNPSNDRTTRPRAFMSHKQTIDTTNNDNEHYTATTTTTNNNNHNNSINNKSTETARNLTH